MNEGTKRDPEDSESFFESWDPRADSYSLYKLLHPTNFEKAKRRGSQVSQNIRDAEQQLNLHGIRSDVSIHLDRMDLPGMRIEKSMNWEPHGKDGEHRIVIATHWMADSYRREVTPFADRSLADRLKWGYLIPKFVEDVLRDSQILDGIPDIKALEEAEKALAAESGKGDKSHVLN